MAGQVTDKHTHTYIHTLVCPSVTQISQPSDLLQRETAQVQSNWVRLSLQYKTQACIDDSQASATEPLHLMVRYCIVNMHAGI